MFDDVILCRYSLVFIGGLLVASYDIAMQGVVRSYVVRTRRVCGAAID